MPRRNSVYNKVPPQPREELDRLIIASGYGEYRRHQAWLAEQGYNVSRSALQRYGAELRERVERHSAQAASRAADTIARLRGVAEVVQAFTDEGDGGALDSAERTASLLMMRAYEAAAEEDIDAKDLHAIARSLSSTLRTVTDARTRQDVENAKDRKTRGTRSLSRDGAAWIRSLIEGGGPQDPDLAAGQATERAASLADAHE